MESQNEIKDLKKIGVVSCYYHHNYGSMLQAYATEKTIRKIGYEAITVQCCQPKSYITESRLTYYFHKIRDVNTLKRKIREKWSEINLKKYPEIVEGKRVRDNKFTEFSQTMFNLSKLNKTREELREFTGLCYAVVVGSDQLWHPGNVEHDYFTLSFVPNEVKKISYATSIGVDYIPRYIVGKYREFLSRFHALSVREKSAVGLINSLNIGKKAQWVVDPTLLLTASDWLEIQKEEPIEKQKYIFCYFLGVNQWHREFANKLKSVTGYKILTLQHLDEFIEADVGFGDIKPYDIGPAEWINLVRNAEFVCTDSFHGTCFSILNHKVFFTMNRYASIDTESRNTRIDSLLSLFNLENRRVDKMLEENAIRSFLLTEIDWNEVDKRLEVERKTSLDYLKDSLE